MKEIHEEPLMCTEIVINISAISNYSFGTLNKSLQIFSVTDNILPLRKLTSIYSKLYSYILLYALVGSLASSFNLSEIITSNIHFHCDENDPVDLELSIQLQVYQI